MKNLRMTNFNNFKVSQFPNLKIFYLSNNKCESISIFKFLNEIIIPKHDIKIFETYLEDKIYTCEISLDSLYTFLLCIFYNFLLLKIIRFKIYFKN